MNVAQDVIRGTLPPQCPSCIIPSRVVHFEEAKHRASCPPEYSGEGHCAGAHTPADDVPFVQPVEATGVRRRCYALHCFPGDELSVWHNSLTTLEFAELCCATQTTV